MGFDIKGITMSKSIGLFRMDIHIKGIIISKGIGLFKMISKSYPSART